MAERDPLQKLLLKLRHLNLTRLVAYDPTSMRASGGYSDIFVGRVAARHLRCYQDTGNSSALGNVNVAVKRIRAKIKEDSKLTKFLTKEMYIWSKLNHPNVLPLLGFILESDYPALVSLWIDNGTVMTYLKSNPDCDITELALGIAKGLEYLHDNGIVHSDLKSDNILIGNSGEPLICDFGISRMLISSQTFFISTTHGGGTKGTTRWMAHELLSYENNSTSQHTKETDVWAYGMTLYEVISKHVPFIHLKADQFVILALSRKELPPRPATLANASPMLEKLWGLCQECWKSNPEQRPTAASIVQLLSVPQLYPVATFYHPVPTLRTGGYGVFSTRATTSKQACDQCVIATLPCDGANPCSKCIQRKGQCTYVKYQLQTAPSGPGRRHGLFLDSSSASSLAGSVPRPGELFLGPPPMTVPSKGTAGELFYPARFAFNAPPYPPPGCGDFPDFPPPPFILSGADSVAGSSYRRDESRRKAGFTPGSSGFGANLNAYYVPPQEKQLRQNQFDRPIEVPQFPAHVKEPMQGNWDEGLAQSVELGGKMLNPTHLNFRGNNVGPSDGPNSLQTRGGSIERLSDSGGFSAPNSGTHSTLHPPLNIPITNAYQDGQQIQPRGAPSSEGGVDSLIECIVNTVFGHSNRKQKDAYALQ